MCGENTYFCLLLSFLPAWFHALLVPCIGRGSEKENPCVNLWVDDFLPSLAREFSRGISERSYSTPFIVLAVFFAPFAGVFLIGDNDAGIQGTRLG